MAAPFNDVAAFVAKAAGDVATLAGKQFMHEMDVAINERGVSSPIEQLFLAALHALCLSRGVAFNPDPVFVGDSPLLCDCVNVVPQCGVGKFRIDFVVTCFDSSGAPGQRIAVELDGHKFHDRSERERSREKARDRFLSGSGYRVMHFTGADVVRDPYAVAYEALVAASPNGEYMTRHDDSDPLGLRR